MVVKDDVGQVIREGSFVAYGVRDGNCGDIRFALVKSVEDRKILPIVKSYRYVEGERINFWRVGRESTRASWDHTVVIRNDVIKDADLSNMLDQTRYTHL